ncbi:hypothetical protein ESOMN_v1c01990 [Williamsoniiplasma somnilux]|uniref:Uncharacterized protein n=1 Tax=Williamsoniiplasma somnilux TaxID=215578 RepID=A0A2K8NXW6_9MOLU|nr:hypothetical protein ESOMN_v1c01990 [Williamsoniiplasma somnilux]
MAKLANNCNNHEQLIFKNQLLKHSKILINLFEPQEKTTMTTKEFQKIVLTKLSSIDELLDKLEKDVAKLNNAVFGS